DESLQPDPFMSLRHGGVELYLVRHADALPDADEVIAGGYDAQALSALGRRQAEALGDRLRTISLAAIYTSPMARAIQTAGPTAVSHELEIQPIEELREIALGTLESDAPAGTKPEEISALLRTRLREIATIAVSTGSWESIPGTEPSALLRARLTTAIDHIIASHPGERVLIVSHAGAINAYLAALLGISHDYFFPTANTSISVIRAQGERRMLFSLNDIAHLAQAGLFPPRDEEAT
ncbi:MAG TPA: histidine phosphatase family protein, partial [Ktedonobacterales bacterium]|nr:histidine phosphatase family protein [Ktedonobacterales bacterium]